MTTMKTNLVSAFVLAALFPLSGAWAQTAAASAASNPTVATAAAPAPNQIVYSPRLPSATELTNAAAAQGLTVEKIEQSDAQVTAFYKNSTGQTNIVSYQLLPATSAPAANAPTVIMPTTPAPTVVQPAPSVVYYEPAYRYGYAPGYYPAYDYGYYPPVSLSLGFGFRGGHGGFRGGFHHWR